MSLPHVPLPVSNDSLPCGMPPMPVSRSSGVSLGHGRGGGSSAALVSAWLPKRTRIELIADSRATSCILVGASEEGRREWKERRFPLYRTNVREAIPLYVAPLRTPSPPTLSRKREREKTNPTQKESRGSTENPGT